MLFFFFNDTATTEIYTLSLHDALPISPGKFFDQLKIKTPPKPPDMMANFMLVSYLKTVLRCRNLFSHNELISAGHFWAKKNMPYSRVIKIFSFRNLSKPLAD